MIEASPILNPQTSPDTHNVTFSQALEAGLTHYDWLDGLKIEKSGRDLALVSHSVSQEKAKDLMTQDTCGPLFAGLSLSASLQRSLENRLRQRMEGLGSPEYVLTWKHWDIGSEPPICALRASGHRTSGKDCGGWGTPRTGKTTDEKLESWQERHNKGDVATMPLTLQAQMAGWHTPKAQENEETSESFVTRNADRGMHCTSGLGAQAKIAGWPTPKASEGEKDSRTEQGVLNEIRRGKGPSLSAMSHVSGWVSPTVQDHSRGCKPPRPWDTGVPLSQQISGVLPSGGLAEMENIGEFLPDGWTIPKNGRLNPRFSLWLMGYPIVWASCGERVTQSVRRSRKSSSGPF